MIYMYIVSHLIYMRDVCFWKLLKMGCVFYLSQLLS